MEMTKQKKQGGMITMPFIFANEICEKLAVVGFGTNMQSYLTSELHLPLTQAANTLTNFGGTSALTPLLGAFIADSFAGRFWTITLASIVYQIGMISFTVSAVVPKLRPPPCKKGQACQEADSGQLAVLYASLVVTALGSGGIRPCVVSFGADQFDEKEATWKFFNWYYFCMGASILVANTVIVYIQDNIGWGWGLGVPTVAMFLSVVAFVAGYPLYRKLDIRSPPSSSTTASSSPSRASTAASPSSRHGRGLPHLPAPHPRGGLRRGPPQACRGGGRSSRCDPDVGAVAGAAVLPPRDRGGVHVDRAPGVLLRPGAREHAEHRHGALLAVDLRRQLHEHAAGDGGAQIHGLAAP